MTTTVLVFVTAPKTNNINDKSHVGWIILYKRRFLQGYLKVLSANFYRSLVVKLLSNVTFIGGCTAVSFFCCAQYEWGAVSMRYYELLSLQLLNVHVVERLSSVGGICTTRLVGPNDPRLPSRYDASAAFL